MLILCDCNSTVIIPTLQYRTLLQPPSSWIMERTHHNNTAVSEQELTEPLTLNSRTSYDQDIPYTSLNEGVHLASVAEKRHLWWRNAIINTLFIASWFFFATILSVYNKWMFSASHFGFPAPLFVTTMHMFVQFSMAAVLRRLWPKKFKSKGNPSGKDYATKAVPTAIATGMDIGLSNLSLKTITLSFYTMCKSSSLIFVLLFAFLFRLEVFSWRLVAVILLIFSGVVLMVATEAHFVLEGLILVLSASALGGLRWSLTQVLLKNKKMGMDNPASTIFWLSPCMGLSLGVVSAIIENWASIFRSEFFKGASQIFATIFYLTAPGVIAFCMVMSEFYIIQRTGVVPMSIAGIAKEVSTILISTWFFGDKLTWVNALGVSITICGIGLFTHHKYRKSMESTVPLDAHGNPILDEDDR
ncbi:triose-phosphate transporter family-domain-containing protein [Panaeolus papilionaceus]|nr:triose-phosphate transporter family-domain-containing protein [Panaeolus papilionaceus]